MRLFTEYLFILNIALCYGQLFEKNICVGNVEIAFSLRSENFNGAKTSCQSNFGGDMVKIGSAEIQAAIRKSIVVKPIYYIGANDADGDNEYQWVADNTAVRKNFRLDWPGSSSGYQNWKSNQPNDDKEKCVVLGEHSVYEWSDFGCGRQAQFICQRRSWRILTITKPNNIVTCESSIPDVSVKWQKNSIDVKSSDRSGVYQENRSNTATLHPENANITESGTYTCVSAVSSCSARRSYNVTVDGTPTIQSIVGNKCNASLFVTWKPNKAAVGFIHRFTAIGTKISVDVTPTGKDFFMTEIGGLAISRAYNVQVKVCEANDACTTSYTANDKATTDGVTSPVTQATITRNGTCQAKWKGSDSTETYTIETKCTVDKSREVGEGKTSNETTKNWKTTTFTFQAASNRKCSATIWAKGCGKVSTPVSATGSCTTPPKEPPALKLPTVEGNGTSKTIKISKPNEDNGLISCIFIVLCYDDCSDTQFSLQDLEKASQTDATNNTEKANTIAVAINMSRFLTNPISRKLSQREVTRCNLYNTGLTTATSVKRIKGNNYIHNSTKNVWAYAVTSTPSENNILFQSSGPILVLEDDSGPEPQGSFQTWIIGLIIGILVVVSLVILVINFIRRRNQHADSPKPQNGNEAAVPHTETRFGGSVRAPRQFENPINREEGEAGGGYMNFVVPVDDGTSINVRDLESRYNNMKNSGAFKVQYDEIVQKANKLGKTTDVAKHETVIKKNRYKNILPFDDSRVSLAGSESGYINASFVNGFRQPNRYIATQGPLKSTIADFWLMTMEQNSQIIVMLTREYDAGKKKCEKYWPDFGKAFNFSNGISVESRQETSCNSYIERMLIVQHKATGKTLTTYQYQFMKWPDHGVPQTTSNLMRMQRVVTKKLNELGSQAPIIVHCSAGAGRTGAFIAYDILLKESQATGKVDVYVCVMEMRKRRIQMVQNCDQYTLVYKLLVEENIFDDYDASADQAKMKLQEILTSNAGAQQLKKEFGQLDRIEPMKNQKLVGIEKRNRPYNRGRLAIPYDYSLAGVTMKMGETSVPYVNASFVEAYDNSTKMIAAQGPFENTVEIFWRAVMDNNVTTIVMLCDLTEGREEQSAQYWPPTIGGTSSWGNITVVKISEEAIENITERKMELKRGTEVKYVTQFHFTEWKENSSPDDTREILELVNKMQKHSRSAGEGAAVLVHCNDGIGRTGAFCTIVNLIDRMKWENRIDVFRTVKDLRDGRPYMVKSLDQYQFCYQAIVGYLKSFELYANF